MKEILRKTAVMLLAMTVAASAASAQNSFRNPSDAFGEAERIIRRYSGEKNAEAISISSFLIGLVRPFITEKEARHALDMAKGVTIVELEDCSAETRRSFNSEIKSYLGRLGTFKVMEIKDEDDSVIIIGDERKISGMLVATDGGAVLISLSATPEQMEKIIQSAN